MLQFRKPKCVVLKQILSTSGKYKLFYGYHFIKKGMCFDVGTINQQTGEIITRHYIEQKPEALKTFHEYEKGLTKPALPQEHEDNDPRIADAFRRALAQRNVKGT